MDLVLALDPKANLCSDAPCLRTAPYEAHTYYVKNGLVRVDAQLFTRGIAHIQEQRARWRLNKLYMCTPRNCACGRCPGVFKPVPFGLYAPTPNPSLQPMVKKGKKQKLMLAKRFEEVKGYK